MLKDKGHSFSMNCGQSSFLKKKLCALSIFMCMLINGFALSTTEAGRHSLFIIAAAATQNVLSAVIGRCNESLAEVSNKLYLYIGGIIFESAENRGLTSSGKTGDEGKETGNASNASAVINKTPVKELKRVVNKDGEKADDVIGCGKRGFSEIMRLQKFTNEKNCGDIKLILFLIFIAAIMRRKGGAGYISVIKSFGKIRISA